MEDQCADGFISRDGQFITIEDVERMFELGRETLGSPAKVAKFMFELAQDCAARGKVQAAHGYCGKAAEAHETGAARARCLLHGGQLKEKLGDYPGAVDRYAEGMRTEGDGSDTRYLLHNNTGYCLNELGRHQEAERFCREAIGIDPLRHNAHKNIGVDLAGLDRFVEAAISLLTASEKCPEDRRALGLLEKLIQSHPEIADSIPDFQSRMHLCRAPAAAARN